MSFAGMIMSVLAGAVVFLYWRSAAKGRLSLGASRAFLLMSVIVLALIPFSSFIDVSRIGIAELPEVSVGHSLTQWVPQNSKAWSWSVYTLLLIGAAVQFIPVVITAVRTYRWRKIGTITYERGFAVVESPAVPAPCTFLKTVYLPIIDSEERELILRHEVAHIARRHQWDAMISLMVRMFAWWNPFFWALHSDLRLVHEKQADVEAVLNTDGIFYKEMLVRHAVSGHLNFTHQYSLKHQIKERMKNLDAIPGKSAFWSALSFSFLLIMSVSSVYAQESRPLEFSEVDQAPLLSGCEEATIECFVKGVGEHIGSTLKLPEGISMNENDNKFWVSFAVTETADIDMIDFQRVPQECSEADASSDCGRIQRAIAESVSSLDIIRAAKKDGKYVKVQFTVPINVRLE